MEARHQLQLVPLPICIIYAIIVTVVWICYYGHCSERQMPSLGWDSSNLHLLLSKVDSISLELTYVLHPNLCMSLHLCRKPLSLLQTSLSPSHETPWSLPAGIFFHTSRYFMVRPPDPMWVMWFRVQGPERLQAPLGAPMMRLGKPPTCWVLFTINDKIKVTKMLLSEASCEKDTSRCLQSAQPTASCVR